MNLASASRLSLVTLFTAAGLTAAVHAVGVHSGLPAVLTYSPQTPRVGPRWHVSVSLQSPDPTAVHPARRVWLVGDMSGHAVRPVEAELTRGDEAGNVYFGALEFAMRGPWRVTVRSEELNDVFEGSVAVEVVGDEDSTGLETLRNAILLQRPDRPTMLPPGRNVSSSGV